MPTTPLTRDMLPKDALGSRIFNALRQGGYQTVESVAEAEDADLAALRGVGVVCLPAIRLTFAAAVGQTGG